MSKAEDCEIMAWARQHGHTVVTLDADFHAEVAVSGASGPSVIRLRKQDLDGSAALAAGWQRLNFVDPFRLVQVAFASQRNCFA